MSFQTDYESWLNEHLSKRKGERLRRLKGKNGIKGLNHAEKLFLKKVWYPVVGNFRYLHPEYEIIDEKDGSRFLDFAFLPPFFRVVFEIDGYGPHQRDVSRWQFSDERRRQNDLALSGWLILRFSYDDIKERPRSCQQTIHRLMSFYSRQSGVRFQATSGALLGNPDAQALQLLSPLEKEIVLFAQHVGRPFEAGEICKEVHISVQSVRRTLKRLSDEGILLPVKFPGQMRVRKYKMGSFRKS